MGARNVKQLEQSEKELIHAETGFSFNQIERLYSRFIHLDATSSGVLAREDLQRIPELAINPLCERIISACLKSERKNGNTDGQELNFRGFIKIMAIFRPVSKNTVEEDRNSRTNKLHFVFDLYDSDCDGCIDRSELVHMLHMMVGSNISSEQMNGIALRTIEEADTDRDGFISFEEFTQALEKVDIEQKMSIRFLD